MENALVDIFTDLVYEYGIIYEVTTHPKECPDIWFERSQERKFVLLNQFQIGIAARDLWKQFKKSKDRKNLNEKIISIIDNLINSRESSQKASLTAYKKLSVDDNQWLDLFKYFGLYILENHIVKLPKDKQLDIEKIRNFLLEEPTKAENLVYIRFDVNTYWRNIFIKDSIKKAFAFARNVNKTLFIIIGQDHFKDIESFIKSEGYPLESYPFNHFYTEENARAALEL